MTLTPEQKAEGWIEHDGSDVCPIQDDRTTIDIMLRNGRVFDREQRSTWFWHHDGRGDDIIAYRIIEAHGADAAPARPTPWPQSYADLVFSDDGWSQTIIVDGKRPEWLERGDKFKCTDHSAIRAGFEFSPAWFAIRVRRREPKRETVECMVVPRWHRNSFPLVNSTIDLIDGQPDLSTLKIGEDAL